MNIKSSVYLFYFINKRFIPAVLLPCVISFYKPVMNQFLRIQSGLNRFFKGVISADVKPLLFETDGCPEFPMAGIDSPKTAGIVAPVFSLFQPLHAGAVNPMQLVFDILLDFCFQAAAAPVIPMDQTIFRYIQLISAVAAAMPENRALLISFLCRV